MVFGIKKKDWQTEAKKRRQSSKMMAKGTKMRAKMKSKIDSGREISDFC